MYLYRYLYINININISVRTHLHLSISLSLSFSLSPPLSLYIYYMYIYTCMYIQLYMYLDPEGWQTDGVGLLKIAVHFWYVVTHERRFSAPPVQYRKGGGVDSWYIHLSIYLSVCLCISLVINIILYMCTWWPTNAGSVLHLLNTKGGEGTDSRYIHLSIHLSICQSIHLSIYKNNIYIYMYKWWPTNAGSVLHLLNTGGGGTDSWTIHLFIHLSICPCIYLTVC